MMRSYAKFFGSIRRGELRSKRKYPRQIETDGSELHGDLCEFLRAVQDYKHRKRLTFLRVSDYYKVLIELGYRK